MKQYLMSFFKTFILLNTDIGIVILIQKQFNQFFRYRVCQLILSTVFKGFAVFFEHLFAISLLVGIY